MELPKVSLAKESSYVFEVQISSPQHPEATAALSESASALTNHCVPAVLHMKLPPKDHSEIDRENSGRILPWRDSILVLEAQASDGKTIYKKTFQLGNLEWTYEKDRYWGWNVNNPLPDLNRVMQGLADYKIIMTVKKTSLRERDFIQLESQSPIFPFDFQAPGQEPKPQNQQP